MASWIKVQVTLPESPKVFRLARLLGVGRMEALGYAVRWFCWLDTYCANGATELCPDEVDALIGMCGITRAFCDLGWAAVDSAGFVQVMDFDKHNGESSKRRAGTQERVNAHRERNRSCAQCNATSVTDALQKALPEEEREFIDNEGGAGNTGAISDCAGVPAPTPDGFDAWLEGLRGVHPSASRSRRLAPDVLRAAKEAYLRCPEAAASAELLGAYFGDSRLAEGKFYAPQGQRKFFEDLEDVLAHAERWRRWAGWKPRKKAAESHRRAAAGGAEGECGGCSDEDKKAFFEAVRG